MTFQKGNFKLPLIPLNLTFFNAKIKIIMALSSYHQEYKRIRGKKNVSEKLFEELVLFFPVVLVVKADGRIDWFEEGHVNHLIHEDAKLHGVNEDELHQEIEFVKDHTVKVKSTLLNALKAKNQEGELSETLMDLMLSAARVSSESQKNNLIFSEYHNFFDFFRSIVSYFVQPDPDKPFVSEEEQKIIREILAWVGGMTPRNQELLDYLTTDAP